MTPTFPTPQARLRAWLNMHIVDHGFFRAAYNNFHDLGGGMYRCSQPSPAQIRRYHKRYGIRSIVNLRGSSEYGSYELERDVCRELGITLHDIRLHSRIPPSAERVRELRDLFEMMEYPALMHCKSGADRAGLGAALYRIFHLKHAVADTLEELSWRYGHFKQARTGVLDFFLMSYLAYNALKPIEFMDWVQTVYDDRKLKSQFRAEGWASLVVDKVLHRE
ncbi:tyrosine-protein phosphatase [Azoarcus sp. KH32C]|uniref:tyrosine-protein phosphatase n=1 Tax=Azoarcus sp. KH32C TaxID=748247 RepID=UPI0006890A62|nr:tyrosine-protein phosphatase [Azoarcus sp. KH32C]